MVNQKPCALWIDVKGKFYAPFGLTADVSKCIEVIEFPVSLHEMVI